MKWLDYWRALKNPELRTAWIVAVAADALQLAVFPLFAAGGVSPADGVLDLAVGAILIRLLGWHWAFLPSFAAELVPGFDLFPTWTAAVLYITHEQVTSGRVQAGEPEILPPGPAPARRP
jgi:hypothetical protein